jgi:hypothetical protein
MSGHPQGGHYDDGYGRQGQDSYYQDDQYGGQYHDQQGGHHGYQDNQHGDAYYDESYVLYSTHPNPLRETNHAAVLITMIETSKDIISKMAIMMIAASRVSIKMNITTINIMTRVVPKADMGRMAMGLFYLQLTMVGRKLTLLPTARSPAAAATTLRTTLRLSATSQ